MRVSHVECVRVGSSDIGDFIASIIDTVKCYIVPALCTLCVAQNKYWQTLLRNYCLRICKLNLSDWQLESVPLYYQWEFQICPYMTYMWLLRVEFKHNTAMAFYDVNIFNGDFQGNTQVLHLQGRAATVVDVELTQQLLLGEFHAKQMRAVCVNQSHLPLWGYNRLPTCP